MKAKITGFASNLLVNLGRTQPGLGRLGVCPGIVPRAAESTNPGFQNANLLLHAPASMVHATFLHLRLETPGRAGHSLRWDRPEPCRPAASLTSVQWPPGAPRSSRGDPECLQMLPPAPREGAGWSPAERCWASAPAPGHLPGAPHPPSGHAARSAVAPGSSPRGCILGPLLPCWHS